MTTTSKEDESWLTAPSWTPQLSVTGTARGLDGGDAGDGDSSGGMIGRSELGEKGCRRHHHRSFLDWPTMTPTTEPEDTPCCQE